PRGLRHEPRHHPVLAREAPARPAHPQAGEGAHRRDGVGLNEEVRMLVIALLASLELQPVPPGTTAVKTPSSGRVRIHLPAGAPPAPGRPVQLTNPATGTTCTLLIVEAPPTGRAGLVRPAAPDVDPGIVGSSVSPCVP